MTEWQEPDVIWRNDRSWQDKRELVQLERSEFNGHHVYKLRLLWQSDDGVWRWARAKESSSGKAWAELGLRAKEIESLGALLIAESKSLQPTLRRDDGGAAARSRSSRLSDRERPSPPNAKAGELFSDGSRVDDVPL